MSENNSGDGCDQPVSAGAAGALFPPLWVWLVVLTCSAAIAWIRISNVAGDHAVINVLTLILAFIGWLAIVLWFLFFSAFSLRVRLLGLTAIVLGVAGAAAVLRIDHVSGELVPIFAFRWSPVSDHLLAVPPAEPVVGVDLRTATEDDFPGFLGKNRDLRVDHIALDRDWKQSPPRLLWKQPIGAGWSGFATVNGFACTLEQRGDQELVTCYDSRTGELMWARGVQARHSTVMGGVGPRSTPTIHEGRVYTLGATGVLQCLDGATGNLLWNDDLLKRYGVDPAKEQNAIGWGRAASPLVVDNLVVVPAGGPVDGPHMSLAAFDQNTGRLAWEAGNRQISYSSPALATLDGVRQIVIVNEENVTGHDPATGRLLWHHPWPGGSASNASVSQAVPLSGARVLLSKGYGEGAELLQLLRAGDGSFQTKTIWRDKGLLKTKFTNVVVYEDHVYGLSDGILECVELNSGKRKWKRGRYGHGQILAVRDLLLVQSETGDVVLVEANPNAWVELGRFAALEGKSWNNLCLYGSLLLVRNAEQAACYELAVKRPGPT